MAFITPWFPAAKLGIFVHWGLFSTMSQKDRDERKARLQEGSRAMSMEETRERASRMTCENFDMAEWAALFKRWGARYAVLTARHAVGFPLWDTAIEPERSITSMSPCGKDIVREWCAGLRSAGLKVGLYMGHRDWGDPDFCAEMDREGFCETDPVKRDAAWARYIEKRNAKLRELMNNYGEIDQFWTDENWGTTGERLQSEDMIEIVLRANPRIVLNNRYGLPYGGMYSNPEQNIPVIRRERGEVPFEVCDTLRDSNHWQYVKDSTDPYRRKEDILRFFIDTITHGGNYLINVGPDWTGRIPEEEVEIMDYLGEFCRDNAEAIYDSWAGLERVYFGGGSTQKAGVLYLFATDRGRRELAFRGVRNKIKRITRLDNGRECAFRLSGGRPSHNAPAYVWIDAAADDSERPVVYKVEYEGKLDICNW